MLDALASLREVFDARHVRGSNDGEECNMVLAVGPFSVVVFAVQHWLETMASFCADDGFLFGKYFRFYPNDHDARIDDTSEIGSQDRS